MTALITGAGSGLGLGLAELLAARGEPVAALDVSLPSGALERLDRAARALHGEEVDVRDGAAVRAAVARAADVLGPLRLVVNCAGVQHAATFEAIDEDAFRRVVDVNLLGSRNVAAAALEHLGPGGQLVFVASLAGLVPNYAYAAYCASKYGVVGLAEVLRLELKPRGIDVSVVCPPEVETPMVDAERETMLPATRALKALPGTLELEPAVRMILEGIDARRFLIVPGRRARAARLLTRVLPGGVSRAVVDRVVARELRR